MLTPGFPSFSVSAARPYHIAFTDPTSVSLQNNTIPDHSRAPRHSQRQLLKRDEQEEVEGRGGWRARQLHNAAASGL